MFTFLLRSQKRYPFRSSHRYIHSTLNVFAIKPFLLADIGEGITECEVVQWFAFSCQSILYLLPSIISIDLRIYSSLNHDTHYERFVKKGDIVSQFDKICEVQSDKAAVEITSRFDGTITLLHYEIGDMAKVGCPLVDIDLVEESGVVNELHVVDQGVDVSKMRSDLNSDNSTVKIGVDFNDAVGTAKIGVEVEVDVGTLNSEASDLLSQSTRKVAENELHHHILTTPAVRRISKENEVNLNLVKGTGKDGRIMKEDITAYIRNTAISSQSVVETAVMSQVFVPPKMSTLVSRPQDSDKFINLTMHQKAMFKQMSKSLRIPHFGFSEEVSMGKCQEMRTAINQHLSSHPEKGEKYGIVKISFMPIFIKAMSLALKKYPLLNAVLVNTDTVPQLKYRTHHNIGIAMSTSQGLYVPSLKDVASNSILSIASQINVLKQRSLTNTFTIDDLAPGSISFSNIGTVGGMGLHPCLSANEVCIGAVGRVYRVVKSEMVEGKEVFVGRDVLMSSWNADHRVVDGQTMAQFVMTWKTYLEDPLLMMAEME